MPLLAAIAKGWMSRVNKIELTAHCRTLTEDLRYIRVHLYHDILLHRHLGMAVLDLCLHPFGELIFEHGGDDIADPLLGRLGQLELRLRQIIVDMPMVIGQELEDLFDSEAFVSGVMEKIRV